MIQVQNEELRNIYEFAFRNDITPTPPPAHKKSQ